MILSTSDKHGNVITADNNGETALLSLKLSSENRSRQVGVIQLKQRVFEVVRCKSKHLFRKFNAYGFNHKILSETKLFDTVLLSDEYDTWSLPVSVILEKGKFLNFEKQGFELQIFIPLDEIVDYKVDVKATVF